MFEPNPSPTASATVQLAAQLDLQSLRLFVAVAQLGNITAAAAQLGLATSAASGRIKALEAAVGTTLMQRHSRGVQLSDAGQALLHHARAILHSVARMGDELHEYAQGTRGHVRLHATVSAIVQFLPEDLGHFARTHTGVKVELQEQISPQVLRAVQEGLADVGIGQLSAPTPEVQLRPYRSDTLALIVPSDHPLSERTTGVWLHEALQWDFVGLHALSSIAQHMQHTAAAHGRSVRQRVQVTGLDAMCRMVDNGLGLGVMPLRAFELLRGTASLTAIALHDAWARRQLHLIARDFNALPSAARLLVEHLLAQPPT